jgi:hypothetical protein
VIYVDKVAGLVGVKAYVSPGLITAVVEVFAVIAVSICYGE